MNHDRALAIWNQRAGGREPATSQTPEPSTLVPAQGSASRVPLEEIAESFNELHRKLLTGELPPRPFWLEIGNSGYKITDENRDNIALGMLLCLDVRGHLRR
jgi:hypothetical protein